MSTLDAKLFVKKAGTFYMLLKVRTMSCFIAVPYLCSWWAVGERGGKVYAILPENSFCCRHLKISIYNFANVLLQEVAVKNLNFTQTGDCPYAPQLLHVAYGGGGGA